ncbi:MAG: DUF374 domain-containing protein [Bdellovibrionales bacterium]|nr:DUF374 domain-containing protein [Bdellovibrionales bacterium]
MQQLLNWLKLRLISILFHLLKSTWRLDEEDLPAEVKGRLERGEPVVFAHFHEDEWAMLAFYSHRQMNVLVSLSADGGVMAAFLERLGYQVSRGSSSKGGATGLLQLIRSVKANANRAVSLAVDGPRGPRRRAKNGVFKLAESLNAPIVSGAAVAAHPIIFKKSWSKAFVPLPFSRVKLVYAPIMDSAEVKRGVERDDYATLAFALEERMKAAKQNAIAQLGGEKALPASL